MSDKAVRQYLQRHAEVEAGIAESLDGAWDEVVVIPACGEPAETLDVLDVATSGSGARVLAILVVNGSVDSSEEHRDANRVLIAEVSSRAAGLKSLSTSPPIGIGRCGGVDWLVVDRSRGDHALPSGQGVGLARKIGCDIALACLVASKVRGRWIYTTDADVIVPRDYFHPGSDDGGREGAAAALTYRFRHEIDVSTRVGRALGVYEISLRYYVLGLAAASSPYAFQTIGSTLALCPTRYAQVRGFPRRLAAEDFYLLNKLAKVGPIVTPRTEPIRIRQRQSDRVPFGTGRATTTISALDDDDQHAIYDPRCFRVVARWMELLRGVGSDGDAVRASATLRQPKGEMETALAGSLDIDAVVARLEALSAQHARPEALRRALFTWFDGWQTLKLIHAVRDRVFPSRPWREALRHAWFLGAGAAALAREPVELIVERLASLDESTGEQARGVDTG